MFLISFTNVKGKVNNTSLFNYSLIFTKTKEKYSNATFFNQSNIFWKKS